jgi:cholesterol 7-dehydrogenase
VAPLEQQVSFRWFAEPHIPRLMVSYVVGSWISQWRNDIEIWENKIYRQRPLLAKGDGPVHRLRRWLRQFYPDHSSRSSGEPAYAAEAIARSEAQ